MGPEWHLFGLGHNLAISLSRIIEPECNHVLKAYIQN